MEEHIDMGARETVDILQTLANPVRKSVIAALGFLHAPLRFSELMEASGLDPNFDTGQFWYHLSELTKKVIITKDGDHYGLTQFGFKLSKILDTVERECSFLLKESNVGGSGEVEGKFRIRRYEDTDFDEVARLVKEMYHYYWVELLGGEEMSPEYARHTVATDLLVPGTHVYVAEDLETKEVSR